MPKNFVLEAIRHHVLRALERVRQTAPVAERQVWEDVCLTFDITREGDGSFAGIWTRPRPGRVPINQKKFVLYLRGDLSNSIQGIDPAVSNAAAADTVVAEIGVQLGLSVSGMNDDRFRREKAFHDEWASSVCPEDAMVRESFEACTAPENRFILQLLGDLKGRRLLDLGSGLGEASVYFAMRGACVTACDLSDGMLGIVSRVAAHHGVTLLIGA